MRFDAARWPEVWLFLLLSVADIVLTYVLVGYFRHIEANPIARYFINHWGLKGMIGFKLSMVAVFLAVTLIIAQTRTVPARRLLRLMTVVVGAVVIYSLARLARSE